MKAAVGRALLVAALLATTGAGTGTGAGGGGGRRFGTIIRHASILDGSGLPAFTGDIAIDGDHIAAVGDLRDADAATVIDATGLVAAPGFINIHSHAQPDAVATAANMLTQGVTTEIVNADGGGSTDLPAQAARFGANGLAENLGFYIGFNAVWEQVVGEEDRRATPAEIATMRALVDDGLAAGAWGVSSGLDYKPGYYADADEVVAVLSAARRWRTDFPNHERLRPEQRYSSFKGMTETIDLAARAGVTPVITHLKSQGAEQGNAPAVLRLMAAATTRGVYTPADVYPYLAGNSGLTLLVPGWALQGGRAAMLKRFADPALRPRIAREAEEAMLLRFGGAKGVQVLETGQELTAAMAGMNASAGEAVLRLLEQQDYRAILRFGREDDVIAFLRYRDSAIACDCGANIGARIHPRNWGTFPRVLGRYVRDTGALTLPDAIRKMTALPAATIGMADRGYLAPGMRADVVLFDPRAVIDHATYDAPTRPSTGVRDVWVNGVFALRDGRPTGAKAGRDLRRDAHMPTRPMTAPNVLRALSGLGPVRVGANTLHLRFALTQAAGRRVASGSIEVADASTGARWTAESLGVVQTAPGWTSITATLRDTAGARRSALLTRDGATLVLRLDGM